MHNQTSKIPILLGILVSLHSTTMAQTISGIRYSTQPVVMAADEHGNVDVDYVENVTLSSKGEGVLGGTLTQVAVEGLVNYTDINYSATVDNEQYHLIAKNDNLSEVNSSLILSDVVAKKFIFTTQATPSSFHVGIEHDFTTDPVLKAVDAEGLLDVNFTETITLSHNGSGIGTFKNNSVIAEQGIALFQDLTFNYDTTATIQFVANDEDNVGIDFAEVLSDDLTITVKATSIVVPVGETQTTAQFDDAIEVELDETDGVKTAVVKVDDRVINIAVEASGVMSGSVESKDSEGNSVSSSFEVASTRSDTTVDANGNVKTIVQGENNSIINITISADGTVKHEVQTANGLSIALSSIAGADVKVDSQGNITTTSTVEKDGFIFKAIVITNTQGETTTKFVKINVVTNEQTDLSHTLKEGETFGSGNNTEVIQIDDLIYIKVSTSLDNNVLIIE